MCFISLNSSAATIIENKVKADESYLPTDSVSTNIERESIFPEGSTPLGAMSHFTWGADIGASIDVGGDDMSSFDVDVILGYKDKFIRAVGVGVGVHRAFDNGYTFIPLYVVFRSSFRKQPSLLFLDLQGGYSFNTLGSGNSQGGAYVSVGLGINLAMSKKFNSHIILSYGYFGLKSINDANIIFDGKNINYAQIKFGINF